MSLSYSLNRSTLIRTGDLSTYSGLLYQTELWTESVFSRYSPDPDQQPREEGNRRSEYSEAHLQTPRHEDDVGDKGPSDPKEEHIDPS